MDHSDGQLKAIGLGDMVSCSLLDRRLKPQPEQALKCPRCDSLNTKFCYYNNYSLSQPRYFCKACRRYWTKGGTLRNVPVGGGSRKNKRSCSSKKTQETIQSVSESSYLLPLTYDPILDTNNPNSVHEIMPKPTLNHSFIDSIGPLREGFHGMGTADLSLYSLPTGFHNPCLTFSQGNPKGVDCGNNVSQILMHSAVESNVGTVGDVGSKTREFAGNRILFQNHGGGGDIGYEDGKDYWNTSESSGVWNGMVGSYGPSSISPYI